MTRRSPENQCRSGRRHWFAYYGQPGSSAPTCRRWPCEEPNPNYDPDRDPRAGLAAAEPAGS